MQKLYEIIYNAIKADTALCELVGGRVKSDCYEVSPDSRDNTPLPYIIVADGGLKPADTTKDDGWLPSAFQHHAGVEIAAVNSNQVSDLTLLVMRAVANYMQTLERPMVWLSPGFPTTEGTAWDWTKPCFFDTIHYQAEIKTPKQSEQ